MAAGGASLRSEGCEYMALKRLSINNGAFETLNVVGLNQSEEILVGLICASSSNIRNNFNNKALFLFSDLNVT